MAVRLQARLAVLGCSLAALGAVGCGADEGRGGAPLPRSAVAELDKQLGSIERRFAFGDGACGDIERDNRPAVRRTLARLPGRVDPEVRRALRQSFARLFELARSQCAKHKPPPTTAAPPLTATPAPPALPAPATTDTTQTATTDTDTTNSTPTDTTPATNTAETTPPTPERTDTQPNSSGESGGSPAPKPPPRPNPPPG